MSEFIPIYELESLTEQQKQDYIRNVCKHLGVPPELNLVLLTYIDSSEGPRRLVAYAKRGAAEIIRDTRKITITELKHEMIGGSIVFTVTGKDGGGRQEIATGSKFIDGLRGQDLDDAIMTSQTRAMRRMTLQFVGGGILDESEIIGHSASIVAKNTTVTGTAPQPTVQPSSEPGKDITEAKVEFHVTGEIDKEKGISLTLPPNSGDTVKVVPQTWATQEEFEAYQAKKRADAIASLNKQVEPTELVKKPRKPRGPNKPKVNMGPSEPPKADIIPAVQPAPTTPTPVAPSVTEPVKPDIIPAVSTPPPPQIKPRLTQDQVKPFRTRLFQLVSNQLEPAGFAPREGKGNADKMRELASVMFPEISNLNQMDETQWDKYLTVLETKMNTEGAAATIKYIEEGIGL